PRLVIRRLHQERPEDVAHVEDRIGDSPRGIGHASPSRCCSTVASHVGSECRALYATSRSKTSSRRRSHALPGKCCCIASRHARTGMRNAASLFHEICAVRNAPPSRKKTVPLKRNSSGTSPSA